MPGVGRMIGLSFSLQGVCGKSLLQHLSEHEVDDAVLESCTSYDGSCGRRSEFEEAT